MAAHVRWWIAQHDDPHNTQAPPRAVLALAEDARPGEVAEAWPPVDPQDIAQATYAMSCWLPGCDQVHDVRPVSREIYVLAALDPELASEPEACPTCGSTDPRTFPMRLDNPEWRCEDSWHERVLGRRTCKDAGGGR